MLILITYDVSVIAPDGPKRLRNIAKACLDYGTRVQNSVFECELTPAQYVQLKAALLDIYDPADDSLRFYHLGKKGREKVEHHGAKQVTDPHSGVLIL
ncbi:CRISPR-associated endoribonuclease Cas2 [Bacterioplanes sanyensis]|uniref:CRISPR-associated endonuclease Cas2 n=1 Tax=Bacterioplanes sanyensis TaxID=1249553 RepID=UPI00167B7BCC|nr:CRISPR-associated endonuclease Cas2 [Bacterioplanes sanyensis]GGY43282.1 CRISPR-associated endoribonuclease Cas2 [Bacterioplanes sanyensis]